MVVVVKIQSASTTNRSAAATPYRGDESSVDRARQYRHDHVEGGGVGDAQPVHLALRNAGHGQGGIDLLAAAVHDDQCGAGGERGNPARHQRQVGRLFQ